MSSGLIASPSLQKAASIINCLDSSKFPMLLNRITQFLQLKRRKGNAFNNEEMEKLQASLNLNEDDLKLLLNSIRLVIEQAACHMTKPAVLEKQLIEVLAFHKEKAETFANAWALSAKGIVEQLRQQSVLPSQLEEINWSLNIQTATSSRANQTIPTAIFQLGVRSDESEESGPENLVMEFTHAELFEFYKQLETIQGQLDNLR